MLSIGKLAAGQAKYYLDQAEGRVDVVESVGDGLEDYYAGGGEARGEWLGRSAARLGLAGPVAGNQLRAVLEGRDLGGARLRESSSPVRVAGFDLTFSAPKSVSLLFGLGDVGMRAAVREAHDRAVAEALRYVEDTASAVRRGHGGLRVEPADGLIAAAFRHRTSRAGDPQLHTHVLVANLGRGPDGRWSALDGRRLYVQARAASFVYQAVLRGELTRTLGVAWLPVRDGIAEVVGVPRPVMRAFSRRRAEIEAAMAERGASSARAAEAAALVTRRVKDRGVEVDRLAVEWQERASALGFGRAELERVVGLARVPQLGAADWEKAFDALASPTGLTLRVSTFTRRDVIQGLCEELPPGPMIDAARLEAAADRFLSSSRAVVLLPDGAARERESFRRHDGRVVPAAREELRYSTPELLALERWLIDRVETSVAGGAGLAEAADVQSACAARPTLSDEQRMMVERLCLDGDGVSVVAGKAGTGKTFALAAAREAWQAAGHPVLGVAVARRAAAELESDAGIASTSVAALLASHARDGRPLPDGVVLVVDEAGMVPTRQTARLLEHVERAGGKLVLVGDHRQLPELEAGGAFRALADRGHAITLTENQRQVEPWERRALDQLRDGEAEVALASYVAHDRVHIADTSADVRTQLVTNWWAARGSGEAVMIAHHRADVAALNAHARELLRTVGALTGPELRLRGGDFAAGDEVVIKRNDAGLGANNGERGHVLAVDTAKQRLLVAVGDRQVVLDRHFLQAETERGDPTLVHGYAITGHVAQGLTVDRAFVLADDGLSREWGYTALSRGRHANHLYTARRKDQARAEYAPTEASQRDPLARLAAALCTSRANELAIDQGGGRNLNALIRAEGQHTQAVADQRAVEQRRWTPGRARKLRAVREATADAARRLAQLQRTHAERTHAARPFLDSRATDQRFAQVQDLVAERRLLRNADRGLER